MHITKWKMPVRKGYIQYDSHYMTYGKDKTIERVKRSVVDRG